MLSPLAAPPAGAQTESDRKHDQAVQRTAELLNQKIDLKSLPKKVSLTKFLAAVEQQLPKDKALKLRLDLDAFGKHAAEVDATPVEWPDANIKLSLRTVLTHVMDKIKVKTDYRIGAGEIVITTPQRAVYPVAYAIDLSGETASVDAILQSIIDTIEAPEPGAVQIENNTRLLVRAGGKAHAQLGDMMQLYRSLTAVGGDLSIHVQAKLYEVDEAFHTKLSNAKYVPLEELERIFIEGKAPKGESLHDLLDKQKLVLAGPELKLRNSGEASLLSRQRVGICLPSPQQVRQGTGGKQTFLEGVSFSASVHASADRRGVRMKLTEKATELRHIEKVKAFDPKQELIDAEIPNLRETAQTLTLQLPDGGSMLVPVQHRPAALRESKRYWVLHLTSRIYLDQEERLIRLSRLGAMLPNIAADLLTNPRLKAMREIYGTPGDKRYAVADSEFWTWPELSKELWPDIPGWSKTPGTKTGKRLLGIRVDQFQEPTREGDPNVVTVTLVNAGGADNGAAVGGCTLRYHVRDGEKGYRVEIAD